MYRVSSARYVNPQVPVQKIPTQYPYEWFAKAGAVKPTISLELSSEQISDTRKALRKEINDNALNLTTVKTFLYHFLKTIKAQLLENWESYGVTIGIKDQEITPLDLVDVRINHNRKDLSGMIATEKDDLWMAMYVCGFYRLARAVIPEYRTGIVRRITIMMRASNQKAPEMTEVIDQYLSWINDKGYLGLIGCIDMFFHRFNTHESAGLRISTTGSRFKDCAALLSYGFILDYLGMNKITDFMDWIFIEKVGDDIERIMCVKDELTEVYSYFPYQIDLSLVTKSSYSAAANPYLFQLIHVTGCILRSERSRNARNICESQARNILLNASCIAYAFAKNFDVQKVFKFNKEADEEESEEDDNISVQGSDIVKSVIAQALKSKQPDEWVSMLNTTDYQMPKEVAQFVKNVCKGIKNPRVGTMDEYLLSIAPTL